MLKTTRFKNMPVKLKILLPGLTGLLIMMFVITVFWANTLSNALYEAFEEKVALTNSYVAAPLATAAWNYDSELADSTLQSLSQQDSFVFAQVVSAGDVLAETSKSGQMEPSWLETSVAMLEAETLRQEAGALTFFQTPLSFDGEVAGSLIWALDTSIIAQEVNSANITATVLGLVFFASFAVMLFLISSGVANPIATVVSHIDALQKGDQNREIPEAERRDEIGALGKALVSFRDANAEAKRMEEEKHRADAAQQQVVDRLSDAIGKLATGDLTNSIENTFPEKYEQLRTDFNSLIDRLRETISSVVGTAESIRSGSSEITQASDDLARRTESQAATLEETAAALDELTASVRKAADGASSVSETMQDAKSEAVDSSEVVSSAVEAMNAIQESSNRISQIIGVIDDIAFQTNLLALNAGVEAARAGEAGRGFAVVASEVRALAQRSSDAATEIKTLIGDSYRQVEHGVDLVGKTGEALHSIVGQVTQISGLISEIAQGASEQSGGLAEINTGMIELDKVTQQNAAMVEEATAASHMLKGDAANLSKMVSYFKLKEGAAVVQMTQRQTVSFEDDEWSVPEETTTAVAGGGRAQWTDF
ncbi:HAMP domain-containing protein [Epibacterium sp. SM1979]|uniref:HAMP domain-containing protein n=1 Tax=Tritonibacter litoralis TaxID=2662264 RepID=A0A843YEA8_9RHOB|nr:HAMP domain-containing protein [Tritonibacter litoralis]